MAESYLLLTGIARPGGLMARVVRKGYSRAIVELPLVRVDSYNLEIRDEQGFVGDRATNRAFFDMIEELRVSLRETGDDPLGRKTTAKLSKREMEKILRHGDLPAAGLVMSAVEEFAQTLAAVIRRFLREKDWKDTECIVVGGGFRDSRAGELAIGRTMTLLRLAGNPIELVPVRNDPDHAGLLGSVHLVEPEALRDADAMLAVDIGGSSIRAGLIKLPACGRTHLKPGRIMAIDEWKYAKAAKPPTRDEAVKGIAKRLEGMIREADRRGRTLARIVGVGCPGRIDAEGDILAGAQNLPGNWEARNFNLPRKLTALLPENGDGPFRVVMHNDAVVQGLSEAVRMSHYQRWAVVTIGTGLGNARFSNLPRKENTA